MALLLEDALSDSLVDYDECDFRELLSKVFIILFREDLLKLVQLFSDNHLSHGVTNSISVDENMVRHCSFIVLSVSGKSAFVVLLKDVT